MTHPLTPVFVGLRTGLHLVFTALVALVVARAVVVPGPATGAVVATSVVLLAVYAAGAFAARRGRPRRLPALAWLLTLSVLWLALLVLTPEAAYLVFPLFFLYLHLLGRIGGPIAVAVVTATAVVALALHGGWSVGGVVGPMVGAGVAVLIGLGYRALAREAAERERLVAELLAARDRIAASERESGALAERARLARDIHDTVAQGLSSIQLLLHAAERADPDGPGIAHIRLARETAAADLAETRRFIRELSPPALENQGLAGALRRLADTQWATDGVRVEIVAPEGVELPMPVQTALLRIAQGAVANIVQHARASRATITLEILAAGPAQGERMLRLTVIDDGVGFDPEAVARARAGGRTDSFGLRATRERVEQLGGTLLVDSAPGRGTRLVVDLAIEPVAAAAGTAKGVA
ncbi:sensor histidine kinase [Herbiconiux sp. A18JL235]|uniref:Sensor histidine kinase n=1 Tax=Herbiconiux sp. A18JL235 TaxID=3152363 RepID=A0AB39BJY3_9MICO